MSSKARKNITYKPPDGETGFFHRDHRSRKNRKSFYGKKFNDLRKKIIEENRIKDLEFYA